MIFLDPPCEKIDEHLENCQEDGALRPWLMVMSGPHNIDRFSKLTYTLSCHYDPCHDQIAEWLEDSYIKKFQRNGKVVLVLFLNEYIGGKDDIYFVSANTTLFYSDFFLSMTCSNEYTAVATLEIRFYLAF